MKTAYRFIFVLLVALGQTSFAQNRITGTLRDASNSEAVAFVNIGMLRAADSVLVSGTMSDDDGKFKLVVPEGDYQLRISAIGYETFIANFRVDGDKDFGIIKLMRGSVTLDQVTVTEKRPLFAVEGEKTLYNVAEDPSIQTGTVSDALQNAPGVEVDVQGNIKVEGASSVEVWINDRPSHLNEENLKTYLQTLPANSIDHIEVITNPSARYGTDADGIINIVTTAKVKRNEFVSFGLNASSTPYAMPWVSYVWANDKISLNLYANFNRSHSTSTSESTQNVYAMVDDSLVPSGTRTEMFEEEENSLGGNLSFSFDYQIDSANSLDCWGFFGPSSELATQQGHSERQEFLQQVGNYDYNLTSTADNGWWWGSFGLYYRHLFDQKGHNLSVSVNGHANSSSGDEVWTRSYIVPVGYSRSVCEVIRNGMYNYSADVDYVYPFSKKDELAVGFSGGFKQNFISVVYDTLVGDVYVNDANRSWQYTESSTNYQTYVTFQRKFGNFTLKPGLRWEHYTTILEYPEAPSFNLNLPHDNFLPSLHLSYRTKSMHNIKLSYTHRVSDPRSRQLTTYVFYNEESFSTGNPNLLSTLTDYVEGGWTKYWNKFGSVGINAYYRYKDNTISSISESMYDDVFGRTVPFSRPVNVGSAYNAGATFNVTYRPTGMFNVRFYANLYKNHFETIYLGQSVVNDNLSYSFRINLWTKLWDRLEVHASTRYNSPTRDLFSERMGGMSVNCGMRADFFDRKLSVYLNANDIFNQEHWGNSSSSPYVQSTSDYKYSSTFVSAGFTLRFGKMELENHAQSGAEQGGESQQSQQF